MCTKQATIRTRSINHLPSQVLVVAMTDKERLGRERIGLNIDIGTRHLVHPRTLADVGQTAHEERSSGRIESGKTAHVFSDFVQVRQTCLLTFQNGAHTTQGSSFETFASIERVSVLDHANHVTRNRFDKRTSRVDLTESEFVVVAIIQRVAKIGVKRMNVIQAGKVGQNLSKALRNGLLGKLDLTNADR